MTDSAYSILLFSGLIAGPASAFLVDFRILPFFIVFPLIGLYGRSKRGTLRILLLITAPCSILLWGVISGNSILIERSLRWIAAVAVGASMSGALGASRTSELLLSVSRRVSIGGLPESLAMAVSLAGPFSERVKAEFTESRKNGRNYGDAITAALSSISEVELTHKAGISSQNALSALSATAAWLLLLAALAGVLQ
jgi:hypothetical protein